MAMIEEMFLRFVPGEPDGSLPTAHDTVKVIANDATWYVHIRRVIDETPQIDGTVVLRVLASRERCGDELSAK